MNSLGRPLEFDPEKAIESAMEVFWCKGYEATSMTDLLDAMNISKSSLYQTFGSKQQLFEHCLARYAALLSSNMELGLSAAPSGRSFIKNMFDAIADTAQQAEGAKGCLMVNSVNEFGQRNSTIAMSLDENLQLFTKIFIRAIKRAQSEGDIPAEADPGMLAHYLHVGVSGLRTMIKAGADKKSAHGTVTLLLKALG